MSDTGAKSRCEAKAMVPTPNASRHLQQLCKHWSHNLDVTFDPQHGSVTFPSNHRGASWPGDGHATFDARDQGLAVRIEASSADQLERLKGAVASHLDRFAFREAPLTFDWR